MLNTLALKTYVFSLRMSELAAAKRRGTNFRNIKPNFNFPGGGVIRLLLAWFLAIVVVGMVVLFFACAGSLARTLTGRSEGGAGRAFGGMILALIIGGLALAGTSTFFAWSNYFSVK
jgi:hypothetical protein